MRLDACLSHSESNSVRWRSDHGSMESSTLFCCSVGSHLLLTGNEGQCRADRNSGDDAEPLFGGKSRPGARQPDAGYDTSRLQLGSREQLPGARSGNRQRSGKRRRAVVDRIAGSRHHQRTRRHDTRLRSNSDQCSGCAGAPLRGSRRPHGVPDLRGRLQPYRPRGGARSDRRSRFYRNGDRIHLCQQRYARRGPAAARLCSGQRKPRWCAV